MNDTRLGSEPPQPAQPPEPATSRVAAGFSPRIVAGGAIAVLGAVVAIGVMGRGLPPVSDPVATDSTSVSNAITAPSQDAPPMQSAQHSPNGVATNDGPDADLALPLIDWNVPAELYQIVVQTGRQTVRTIAVPNYDPSFDADLSLDGAQHRMLTVSLNSVSADGAQPVPTKIRNWQIPLPPSVTNGLRDDAPIEIFRADLGASSDDPSAPLLQRAAYEFRVNARTKAGITHLYFFIQFDDADPAIQRVSITR